MLGREGPRGRALDACARRTAVGLFLALASPLGYAGPEAPPGVAMTPEKRVLVARERGFWVVSEGETLLRIARHFITTEGQALALAEELRERNDHATIGGNPAKLVVGARLNMPQHLRFERALKTLANRQPSVPAVKRLAPQAVTTFPPPDNVLAGVPPVAAGERDPTSLRTDAASASVPPAYVDRVLTGPADDRETGPEGRPRDESPGLHQWAAELRSEQRRLSGTGTTRADGIGVRYTAETEFAGDFTLLGQLTRFDPPAGDPKGERTRATGTLLHDNFALAHGWFANSALGIVRPALPIWLASSYRVSLAPSMLSGGHTALSSPTQELRLGAGRIGQLSGFGIQQFERTSGEQALASYVHRVSPDWSIGGAAIAVRDGVSIPDHATTTFGVNRAISARGPGIKVQGAITDSGERAAWFDFHARSGRLVQRFGAYHVDPDFIFGESAATRDVRGAYWRGEYRSAGNFYSFGVEGTQDNLRRDPLRGGSDTAGAYGLFTRRLDRTTQVGAGASGRREEPRTQFGTARDVAHANLFASKAWGGGVSRFDANYNSTRPQSAPGESARFLGWNQEWPRWGPVDFTTLLSQTDEDLAERQVRRRLASASARGPISGSLRWDASVTFVDIADARGGERNYNAALSLDWNPVSQWTLQAQLFRNRVQPGPDNPLAPFIKEEAVLLNVRYEDTAGTPYPRVAGGRSGTGRITGSVFFDENGDGVRQANERGAAGVQVVLDERQAAVTDSDGRFQFPLVPAGAHRIRVLVERVPLPWGLDDDAAREVRVDVRTDARLDIGLRRISP